MSGSVDRKVAICTPIHRLIEADFATSLFQVLQGFPAEVKWIHCIGHANLARARNYLTARARAWGATDIVFIDSDIGFEPKAFIALFENDARVVAGCPQRRDEALGFCGRPDIPVRPRRDGLIPGEAATAFLRVSSDVFDELDGKAPRYAYQGEDTPAFFQTPIADGELLDEDISFSRMCRTNGIEVWLDPTIAIRHWHTAPLTGRMTDHISFTPLKDVANG